jgi:CheY-like chemotaxis protein
LRVLPGFKPNVLISDIGMPGTDGYELMRRIKRLPVESGLRVPAIAVTAFARPEDRARALEAGYALHLPKPIEPVRILMEVARLLRKGDL